MLEGVVIAVPGIKSGEPALPKGELALEGAVKHG